MINNRVALVLCGAMVFSISATAQKPKAPEWKVPANEASRKSGIAMNDDAVKEGKALWSKMCKSCHGAKGLGDGPKAGNIEVSCGDFSSKDVQNQSDGALFYKITKGRDDMPTFSKKLSDEERWQLVAFIRTLKKDGGSSQKVKENGQEKQMVKTEKVEVKKDAPVKEVKKTPEVPVNKDTVAVKTKKDAPVNEKQEVKLSPYTSPEYIELKTELEHLRKQLDSLNIKLDILLEEKKKN